MFKTLQTPYKIDVVLTIWKPRNWEKAETIFLFSSRIIPLLRLPSDLPESIKNHDVEHSWILVWIYLCDLKHPLSNSELFRTTFAVVVLSASHRIKGILLKELNCAQVICDFSQFLSTEQYASEMTEFSFFQTSSVTFYRITMTYVTSCTRG